MALETERGAFPYPELGDPDNVPTYMAGLANRLAAVGAIFAQGTTAARAGLTILHEDGGLFYWSTDDLILSYYDGDDWNDIFFDLSGLLTTSAAAATYLTQANAATTYMPKGGGTFSGTVNFADNVLQRPELRDAAETCSIVAAAGADETLDYTAAAVHDLTLDANCTLAFTNPPAAGKAGSMLLIIRQPASVKTVTWPASVKWPGGVAPTMAGSTVNTFVFTTIDGGTTWLGATCALDHR